MGQEDEMRRCLFVLVTISAAIAVAAADGSATGPVTAGAGASPGATARAAQQAAAAAQSAEGAREQRLQEMSSLVEQMHTVLNEMQSRAAGAPAEDKNAADNVKMWQLLLAHLDRMLAQAQGAPAAGPKSAGGEPFSRYARHRFAPTRRGAPAPSPTADAMPGSSAATAETSNSNVTTSSR
jgi:hypothetical protein